MRRTRALAAALATTTTALAVMGAAAPRADLPDSSGSRWPHGSARTVGRLVAQLPHDEVESCSAAIVDAPNGSVVATAAHCLRNPDRPQKPKALYFQPGYDHKGGPRAVIRKGWKVTSWKSAPGWDVHKDLESILPHDWAFLRMEKRNGRTIQQAYGANALRFAPVGGGRTASLGYPAVDPYDGETLDYCAGNAHLYRGGEIAAANVGALSLRPCNLTQGVSGGPWLRDYDPKRQAGTVVAVTSVGTDDELLGRPFPKSARAAFRRIGSVG